MGDYTKKENVGIMEQTDVPEQGVFFRNKIYGSEKKFFRILTEPSATQCNHCKQMQGVVLYGSEAELKSALPPYHPNCRCSYEELDEATYLFLVMQAGIQSSGKLADVGKGIYVFDVFGRYGFNKTSDTSVFGILDKAIGKESATNLLWKHRGAPLLRIDLPQPNQHFNGKPIDFNHMHLDSSLPNVREGHIKVSDNIIDLGVNANKVGKVLKVGGKAVAVVGVVLDAADIGTAMYEDDGWGENTNVAVGGAAGSWAGAWAGGAVGAKAGVAIGTTIGAAFGGVGAAPGAAIGGLVGGLIGSIGGAIGGRWLGEQAGEMVNDAVAYNSQN